MNRELIKKQGILQLLKIKDSDIRIMTLEQGNKAIDKGIHAGGAFSSVIPLVSLYYGGFIRCSIDNPTCTDQDQFVLSKGHAVASMASIYADLGYFDKDILNNSRSVSSILNGHPGPILPGVQISTGPLGQGACVAQGYALAATEDHLYDVFALLGDGELQEGIVWEAIMHAGHRKLDNLCYIVDKNNGQLDRSDAMILPMDRLENEFAAFGWKVLSVNGMQYEPVYDALKEFKEGPRDGRPTVIICNTVKGYGAYSQQLSNHKITLSDELAEQEIRLQKKLRKRRAETFVDMKKSYEGMSDVMEIWEQAADTMNLSITAKANAVVSTGGKKKCGRAQKRDKKISYDESRLPVLDTNKAYAASDIIKESMKVFAQDSRIVSIDADLGSTSGLQAGVGYVESARGLNVGIAEANMMNIGEAYASLGYNTWISTFCPFFDLKVLRRIAVGHQERLEAMEQSDGWLSEGHGLDLTLLATAPNLETKTNGATHMGNDDSKMVNEIGHMKVIDVSCPNQLLSIMKWIMEGNRGLVYVRIMRSPSAVLYDAGTAFTYGKGYYVKQHEDSAAVIVSSGRGVHEALAAAEMLEKDRSLAVDVIDMPSTDTQLFKDLVTSGKLVVFAEQNNGYLWTEFRKRVFGIQPAEGSRFMALNTSTENDESQYIHSGTYGELLEHLQMSPKQLADTVAGKLNS